MGFFSDKLQAKLGSHVIEVEGQNDILRGLIYKLSLDGEELARAQNFFKIPTRRSLEARVTVDGTERHIVVAVKQTLLSTDYALTLDGETLPLDRVT